MLTSASTRVDEARPDPRGFADRLFEAAEVPFLWAERRLGAVLPNAQNPLAQLGALANASLVIATVSGILLLFWYSPSVHFAHASVKAMEAAPWTAGLVRSLHRYSSDAVILFAILHGARLCFARRFSGARAWAWITGALAVATLWLVGWLGYWLVWDDRARQVAKISARLMDPIPVFTEPLSRAFLADPQVSSLLFFVIFFVHMLVPLVALLLLWLHVTRLSRPKFLPSRPLWVGATAVLVLLSLVFPASAGEPARMLLTPTSLSLDAWYLLPLYVGDRLGPGATWALLIVLTTFVLAFPRAFARGRAPVAAVQAAACNGCTLCAQDCPYDAISMVPRSDGSRFQLVAQVDPDKCLGCGICAGSCVPGGIGVPSLPIVDTRKRIDRWIAETTDGGAQPHLAFLCASSAGASLQINPTTGESAALPGYRALALPCAGWVQPLTVERALKRGARGILVVGCGPTECTYREGATWTEARLAGARPPALRHDKVDPEKIRWLQLDRLQSGRLQREAEAFREAASPAPKRRGSRAVALVTASCALTLALALGSAAPYRAAAPPPELVISFRHPGRTGEVCRDATAEELAAQPPHMRQPRLCERGRAAVRLRVTVDGARVLEERYAPRGIRGDGNSIAIARLPLSEGRHSVKVELGETGDPTEWTFSDAREISLGSGESVAVLFDRSGFSWHEPRHAPPDTGPQPAEASRSR